MPRYAQYNPAVASPSPVIGWYDTDEFKYPNLPAAADLLELTAEQWTAHFTNPSGWSVSGGALVTYTPPVVPLTLVQQAQAALSAGLTITSTSTPTLDGTYDVSAASQDHISAEMIALLNSNGTAFADGTASVVWPDMSGVNHTFNATEGKALFLTVGAYVAALYKVINGTLTTLPAAVATIS